MSSKAIANLQSLFRRLSRSGALSHRNFRLFILGQGLSLAGTWIQQIALGWLVYRLGGSAFLLGAVSFVTQLPTFLISPFAGVMADRWNRHRALLITQTLAMFEATTLVALTFSEAIQLWHIFCLSFFLGCVNAFDMPLRQSFLIEMIKRKEDLPNAIGINSMIVNTARLLGPTIAGLLIAIAGEKTCFLVNALSYLAVLTALCAMKDLPVREPRVHPSLLRGLKDGFKYAIRFKPIIAILLLLSLTSVSAMPLNVLMPIFAAEIFHGGPTTLGILNGAFGLGALLSALHLATRRSVLGLGRRMTQCVLLFGFSMVAFSFTDNFWFALPLLSAVGFGMMLTMAASNTLLQTIVEDDKRGRVMSLYIMAFMGTAPLGSIIAGSVSEAFGAPATVRGLGLISVCGGIYFGMKLPMLRAMVRPVYEKAGIIPGKTAAGLQTAAELAGRPERA